MVLTDLARELIDGRNFGHLAVVTDQGPHVTPVWVSRDGDHVLVNTAEGRVKTRAVRRDPRVALSVAAQDDPYRRAAVRGRVVELRQVGAREHIDALAKKYLGKDTYPGPAEEQRVILVIEPVRVV